jgi:hypothetical protein
MTRISTTLLAVTLIAAGVVPGTGSLTAQTAPVVARDAWAREPAPSRDVTALFVVLENHSAAPRSVVSAFTDAADTAELHEMKMDNGKMSMSPVKQIDLPAGGKTELKPGGLHDTLSVTLTLDDGTKVPVSAIVRKQESPQ